MQIEINAQKKFIDIWLMRDELPPDIDDLRSRFPDFDINIWRSGHESLVALTAELLRNNK